MEVSRSVPPHQIHHDPSRSVTVTEPSATAGDKFEALRACAKRLFTQQSKDLTQLSARVAEVEQLEQRQRQVEAKLGQSQQLLARLSALLESEVTQNTALTSQCQETQTVSAQLVKESARLRGISEAAKSISAKMTAIAPHVDDLRAVVERGNALLRQVQPLLTEELVQQELRAAVEPFLSDRSVNDPELAVSQLTDALTALLSRPLGLPLRDAATTAIDELKLLLQRASQDPFDVSTPEHRHAGLQRALLAVSRAREQGVPAPSTLESELVHVFDQVSLAEQQIGRLGDSISFLQSQVSLFDKAAEEVQTETAGVQQEIDRLDAEFAASEAASAKAALRSQQLRSQMEQDQVTLSRLQQQQNEAEEQLSALNREVQELEDEIARLERAKLDADDLVRQNQNAENELVTRKGALLVLDTEFVELQKKMNLAAAQQRELSEQAAFFSRIISSAMDFSLSSSTEGFDWFGNGSAVSLEQLQQSVEERSEALRRIASELGVDALAQEKRGAHAVELLSRRLQSESELFSSCVANECSMSRAKLERRMKESQARCAAMEEELRLLSDQAAALAKPSS